MRFLWTAFGFAVLTLIGISSFAFLPLASHAFAKSSRLVPEVAFNPSFLLALVPGSGHAHPTALRPAVSPAVKHPRRRQPISTARMSGASTGELSGNTKDVLTEDQIFQLFRKPADYEQQADKIVSWNAMQKADVTQKVVDVTVMNLNLEQIPVQTALQIGLNLYGAGVYGTDMQMGAGVYGGIVKRDASGRVIIGDEWPENNICPPANNPVHSTGPYLDFSKLTPYNRGYSKIAQLIRESPVWAQASSSMESLFQSIPEDCDRKKLANLVMSGGARPLHMCGMGRGGNASELISILIKYGADVNAKDNYEYTAMDRLVSNNVAGSKILESHGGKPRSGLPSGVPQWDSDEFAYLGPGEEDDVDENLEKLRAGIVRKKEYLYRAEALRKKV